MTVPLTIWVYNYDVQHDDTTWNYNLPAWQATNPFPILAKEYILKSEVDSIVNTNVTAAFVIAANTAKKIATEWLEKKNIAEKRLLVRDGEGDVCHTMAKAALRCENAIRTLADNVKTDALQAMLDEAVEEVRLENSKIRDAASCVLHDIDNLVSNSQGVIGLHKNGDVAEWSDILEGGTFEAWLMSIENLRNTLDNNGGSS